MTGRRRFFRIHAGPRDSFTRPQESSGSARPPQEHPSADVADWHTVVVDRASGEAVDLLDVLGCAWARGHVELPDGARVTYDARWRPIVVLPSGEALVVVVLDSGARVLEVFDGEAGADRP